ncbi:MAG: hypothetical protein NTU63_00535 [Candidatus Pacearchaeota archaeon]|nr:hypothetical protein [Candidatus Pacearchaeota archaeon]
MKKKFVPLFLLLLTLSGCPNIHQEYTKSKEIPDEKFTLQIGVKTSKNDYPDRIKDYEISSFVINPAGNGLEKQLVDLEDALRDAIKENVKLILKGYNNKNDKGIYTVEVNVIYSTGRNVLMIDDFELGKE